MYGHLHGHGLTVLLSRIETPFLHTLHGLPIQTHPQGLRNTDVSRFPIGIHHKPERNRPPGTAVPALRLKTQGLEQTSPEEERLPFRCERAVRPRFSLQCLCLARIPKRLGRPPVLARICRPCIDPYPSSQKLPRRRTSNNPARCRPGDPEASRIFSRVAPALSRQWRHLHRAQFRSGDGWFSLVSCSPRFGMRVRGRRKSMSADPRESSLADPKH